MHPEFTPKDIARFWAKVDRSGGPDACWPWVGSRHPRGYGYFSVKIQRWTHVYAHRFSFLLANGRWPMPSGMHACDNPPCCNPAHISEGTQQDNIRDCIAKGRSRSGASGVRGEAHPKAKLTDDGVRLIRRRAAAGEPSQAIADDFGVCARTITDIVRGKFWKHVQN
jgi:hypothetical protein